MKKITQNVSFGKLAMLVNILILGMFIVSMVSLLNFDKENVKLVKESPVYEAAFAELREVERPRRQAQADVDYYVHKLDTLKKQTPATDKKRLKEQQEEIDRTINTLAGKEADLAKVDSIIGVQTMFFEAIQNPFNDLTKQVHSKKTTFKAVMWITILLFVTKVIFFAMWKYKSLQTLRITSPWMHKSTAPFWAYVGWLIPGYNFIKPYAVYSEIYNETNFILLDKGILQKDIDSNSDFNIGLWWGLLITTTVLMSYIISATFFSQGPMHLKLSHTGVAVTAIIFWVCYLAQECAVIFRGVKMNQILFENRSKFDLQ